MSALEFGLDEYEQIIIDMFYLSLELDSNMGGNSYRLDKQTITKYCEKYELDFIDSLSICKRLCFKKNELIRQES